MKNSRKAVAGCLPVAAFFVVLALLWFFSRSEPTLPEIPLVRDYAREGEYSWKREYKEAVTPESYDADRIQSSESAGGAVTISDLFLEKEEGNQVDLIIADSEGKFEGSWIKGRVRTASLVPPEFDENGDRSLWRTPGFFTVEGKRLSKVESDSLSESLISVHEELPTNTKYQIRDYQDRYPVTTFHTIAELELADESEIDRPFFTCFEAGTGFESPDSHAWTMGNFLIGEAEMFTWHAASIRCHWDVKRVGGPLKLRMPSKPGKAQKSGQAQFRFLTRVAGAFELGEYRSGAAEGKRDFKKTAEVDVTTAFFAANIPTRTFRFVEYSVDGASWNRTKAYFEQGLGWFQVPSEVGKFEWRIVYYPLPIRIVVDIPAVGGAPENNRSVSNLNEVRFPLGHQDLSENVPAFYLWHLLGSNWMAPPHSELSAEPFFSDPGKLYTIDDLFRQLQKNYPDRTITFDLKTMTFSAEEPEGWWTKLKNEFQFIIIPE